MDKVFRVYVANGDDSGQEVDLPATDHRMLDLMDKLRLAPGELPYLEMLRYGEFEYLQKCMSDQCSLYELNGLAGRLAKLGPQELAAFEGFVGMELQKGEDEIPLTKLIDFAYSTDCCHVLPDAVTDYELGKFYAENGFVPEVEELDDTAFDLLDFGKIGKVAREGEGGVFTSWGYVVRHSDVKIVHDWMDFQPHEPGYVFRLTLVNAALEQPKRKAVLELPATEEQMAEVLKQLGTTDWSDIAITSLDGPLTSMDHDIFYADEIPELNELAKRIRQIEGQGMLSQYKAILCACDCHEISDAIARADTLDDYFLTPAVRTPEEVAREELNVTLSDQDAELLVKHLNLYTYGRDLLARDNAKLTEYGLLERKDGQPIQSMTDQPRMGGMEM